jgi:hypothetical protein
MAAFFGFVGSPRDASALELRAVNRVLLTHGTRVRTFEDRDLEGRHATVLVECGEDGQNGVVSPEGPASRPTLAPLLLFDGPRRDVLERRLAGVRDVDSFVTRELDIAALRGGFAFAIWGRTHRRLALGCDADGIRSLYFAGSERWFVFSTDLGALLACGLVRSRMSLGGLVTYLRDGACGDRTLVSGVRRLRAGCYVIIRPFTSSTGRLLDATPDGEGRLVELRETLATQISPGAPAALVSAAGGRCRSDLADLARDAGAASIVELSFVPDSRNGCGDIEHHYIDPSGFEPGLVLDGVLSSSDQPTGDGIGAWLAASEAKRLGASVLLCDVASGRTEPPASRPLVDRLVSPGDSSRLLPAREISRLLRVPVERIAPLTEKVEPPPPHRLAVRSLSRMAMAHSVSCCASCFDRGSERSGRRPNGVSSGPTGPDWGTIRRWILDHYADEALDALQALAESGAMDGETLKSLWNRFRFDVEETTTARVWALTSLGSWVRRHEISGIEA